MTEVRRSTFQSLAAAVGDGNDESVTWSFDFTGDPDYLTFSGPLLSVLLTLDLSQDARMPSMTHSCIGQ
jgi:hypothetical protein